MYVTGAKQAGEEQNEIKQHGIKSAGVEKGR